jgi:hypothetical protein
MLSRLPLLPMLRIEPELPMLKIEPALPILKILPTLPILARLIKLNKLKILRKLARLAILRTPDQSACPRPFSRVSAIRNPPATGIRYLLISAVVYMASAPPPNSVPPGSA